MLAEPWRGASGDHRRTPSSIDRRAHGRHGSAGHAAGLGRSTRMPRAIDLRVVEDVRDSVDRPGRNADLLQRGQQIVAL